MVPKLGQGGGQIFCTVRPKNVIFLVPFSGSNSDPVFGTSFSFLVSRGSKSGAKFGPKIGTKTWTRWFSFSATMVAETVTARPHFLDQWWPENRASRGPFGNLRLKPKALEETKTMEASYFAQSRWADAPYQANPKKYNANNQ